MSVSIWIESVWQIGMLYAVQSTILILGVMAVARLGRMRDAAVLSMIYRFTMVAVVVSPIVTVGMKQAEIDGWWPATASLKASAEASVSYSTPVIPMPNDFASTGDVRPQGIGNDLMLNKPVVLAAADSLPVSDVPPSELAHAEAAVETKASETSDAGARSNPGAFFVCKTIAVAAWLVVSLALLIRHGRAFLALRRSLKRSVPASSEIQALCDQMASNLQVNSPQVVCSPYFESPFLSGVWSPVIHLCSDDVGMMEASDDGEVRDVLAHELAHLKRHDLIVRMVNHAVLSLLFFQPLLWRLVDWIEGTAEDVCDDFVLELGAARQSYASRLVDLAERCDFPLGSAVGIASGNSTLQHRVQRIMEDGRRLSMRAGTTAVLSAATISTAAILVAGLMFTPTTITAGGPPTESSTPQPESDVSLPPTSDDQAETDLPAVAESTAKVPLGIIRGTILGSNGPLSNANVYWWRSRAYDDNPMKPVQVTTDANGKFELKRTAPDPGQVGIWDMREDMVVRAEGHAFERTNPRKFGAAISMDPDWPGMKSPPPAPTEPFYLMPQGPTVAGRLVDIEGQPIDDARVRIRWFSKRRGRQQSGLLDLFITREPESDTEEDLIRDVHSLVNSIEHVPLRDALPMATTNAEGRFELRELPADCFFELLVEHKGFESTTLVVRNDGGEEVVTVPRKKGFDQNPPTKLYPRKFEAVIGPSSIVMGTVTDADTGLPISGAVVKTNFVNNQRLTSTRERQHWMTRTNAQGKFQIDGLPAGDGNRLIVHGPRDEPYISVTSVASESTGMPKGRTYQVDFQLKRGLWAEGKVFEAETDEPFQGTITYYWFRNRDLENTYPGKIRAYIDGQNYTDADGNYRVPVLPTAGVIAFSTGNRDHARMNSYSRGYGEIEIAKYRSPDGSFPYYDTAPSYLHPTNYNRLALVDPKSDEQVAKVDLPLSKAKPITVTILNPDGNPATQELELYGGNERWGWQDKQPQDFVVEDLLPNERRKVFAFDRSRGLIGGTIVEHGEGKRFEIQLSAAGRAHGRLVDADGEPLSGVEMMIEHGDFRRDDETATWARVEGKRYMPSEIVPDDEGRFEVLGLSPEWKYSARVSRGNRMIGRVFRSLVIKPGEDRDLGDIVIDASQD
ncbi:M56 family metallopeptidase [Allorhodopirellula solitaria]|uniref:BlaR1 peptidase M56 n=1 Tax=Allorhodopirellula solitaria TaxID=2527987 RepID=A0A5C5XUV8_9BACT|nr:M56 family metallopeptidase [Allorhodopirellula solitaria]TWT66694.1 BlaR1 peptidase M56 [Allorhodopirellula solitaria]